MEGRAARLPGFTAEDFRTYIVPVGLLQGAAFAGAATGVNMARDIERGWFDRLADGGTVLDPLAKRPWGDYDGQVRDRYGLRWLIGFQDRS